tara:strand:- start:224 stop:1327 length:1104 start_codon:yes stop_codon:yes gene_type:complete
MSAALIDLVSVGAQDVYITGDPQVSFFRQNYKRHTNFSIKPERMDYIGTFQSGNEVSIPIRSKGDLLSYVWIENANINSRNNDASIFSDSTASETSPTEFSLWIGGQEVTKLDTLFINTVHNTLYNESSAKASCAMTTQDQGANASVGSYIIPFFFSEDWTKSLPLVGLQYHEVEIRIKCRNGSFNLGSSPKVYGSYVFVDTDEREFFAKGEHELLITQTQYQPMTDSDTSIDLTYFNHPVKAVHIAAGNKSTTAYTLTDASMFINGLPLFENMTHEYHRNVVPSRHCSILNTTVDLEQIYTWPFCLTMNKSQPTGTLNFSRIDNARININYTGSVTNADIDMIRAYAVNYNILRIKNGMGGIAFGN